MTPRETIADLSAQLDADPGNQPLRAALADLIDEHAESEDDAVLAAAMRLYVVRNMWPEPWQGYWHWWYWWPTLQSGAYHSFVSYGLIPVSSEHTKHLWYSHNPTRAVAELTLGRVLLAEGWIEISRVSPPDTPAEAVK